MTDLINSIKDNPIVYYIGLLVGLAILCLIIYLIIKSEKNKKKKVQEEVEEKARIERHVDLEAMIAQMQEQEQSKMKDVDPVANFEQEQEEKAIISYQELVNAVKSEKKEPIEVTSVSSTGDILSITKVPRSEISEDKPIFIDQIKLSKTDLEFDDEEPQQEIKLPVFSVEEEVEIKKDIIPEVEETIVPVKEEIEEIKKELVSEKPVRFKNTEFISPIYGRQNNNITYPKISSFTASKDDTEDKIINIGDDVDPNMEFLKTLRDYRNQEDR